MRERDYIQRLSSMVEYKVGDYVIDVGMQYLYDLLISNKAEVDDSMEPKRMVMKHSLS